MMRGFIHEMKWFGIKERATELYWAARLCQSFA